MAQEEVPSLSQGTFISNDPETNGFDLSSGSKWIYPENYPRRDYQFSIVQSALYTNTLVCLPTGLGKTFIAAVVMYNFWRWYPRGRVVFLAPTKPLVAQQIEACHEIMGIPSEQTMELTGAINQVKRRQAWIQKRVIFATPQTFQKDLQNDCVPCDSIKCVVIDEAHKALGKHSYCEIIRMLNEKNQFFRILALSATPGSKIDHVREVIQNLLISELELRDDTSPDIIPYTNSRSMEKIIVPLGKTLNNYKERYISIMDPHVRILVKNQILQGSAANISKGRIFMLMKQYESRPQKANNHGIIMKTLNILLTMYHAYELLIKHGLRAFYNFYSNHSDKFWLEAELDLQLMLEDMKRYIGEFPVIHPLPDGTIPKIPDDLIFGHSKFDKLRELLVEHFQSFSRQNKSTRAIVFVEYRDIVNEVYVLLLQNRPLIRPQMFVGQAGQKQKEQIVALENFRNDKVNVLISTSVGEEGLDVGEVDLIVCFDISTSTPTRLVQRMGRTGRKRSGRVVVLLTEGKEVQTLNQALSKKDSLNNKVLQSSNISSSLYQSSPRMVPTNITPECLSMFIKAQPKTPKVKGKKVKEPAEKKPKKKKNVASLNECSTMQASSSKADSIAKSSGSSQPSMMKYLTDQRQPKKQPPPVTFNYDSDSGILVEEFQSDSKKINTPEDPYVVIRPSEVKLLTSDSHALEFLTLCAMKKSEAETRDPNIIKIDTRWIPSGSNSPVDDLFRNFSVPSLDSLDCIKHMSLYDGPTGEVDERSDSGGNQSVCQYPSDYEDDNANIRESNLFGEFSTLESKYVQGKPDEIDGKRQMEDELVVESDFFDDFNPVESKYAGKIEQAESTRREEEMMEADLFDDDFSTFHQQANVEDSTVKKQEDTEAIVKLQQSQTSSSETIERIPAQVEHDFEEILDEYTESEASQSQGLINEETNIFDDLLNDISTDDDLFDLSDNEQNVTVVPNVKQDTTILERTRLSAKRSASRSPYRETPTKKQRVTTEVESSDGESAIVEGTPPKPRESRIFVRCRNETLKTVPEVAYPDSDQDLFDDDFDTQFSFSDVMANLSDKKEVDKVSCNREKDLMLVDVGDKTLTNKETDKVSFSKEIGKMSFNKERDKVPLNQERIRDEISKEDVFIDKELVFEELSMTTNDKSLQVVSEKQEKTKNETLSIERKNESQSSKHKDVEILDDLHMDDWDDDFDFAPVAPKTKIEQERFSSFFPSSSKSTSGNSRSQESTSSGWITTDQPKKTLTLKNLNPISSSSKKDDSTSKLNFKSLLNPSSSMKKPNEDHKILNAHCVTRPNLRLLSLKRNFNESVNRDKDGFALPQNKTKVSPEPKSSEFVVPNVSDNSCSNKENKLPRWRDSSRKKDNSISPRFRKYHSENDLHSDQRRKKKTKARKRIANDFIDDEAEVSTDVETSEGSSQSGEDDKDLDNFVSYTQEVPEDVDMKAHYLQSMNKSPIRAGAFMFKTVRNPVPDYEIYSQQVSQVDNTYLHDSFCVGDETQIHNGSDCSSSDSVLERIESSLESRRRKMKKKMRSKFKCLEEKRNKNKRNLSSKSDTSNGSSSEDETEALRRQVLEESIMLKSSKK